MTRLGKVAIGVGAAVALIQVVRFEHTNPPITGDIDAPAPIKQLLSRACYDCHSNETKWPWYTNVAPSSWLVHRDVVEGRKELNFSTWAQMPAQKQAKKLGEIAEEIEGNDMPPWFYVPLHAEAKLTDAERQQLIAWAKGAN